MFELEEEDYSQAIEYLDPKICTKFINNNEWTFENLKKLINESKNNYLESKQ